MNITDEEYWGMQQFVAAYQQREAKKAAKREAKRQKQQASIDYHGWHQMMAGAYSCMDTVDMAVGSERCEHCGALHPKPEHWQKKQPAEDAA